jgi:hypothetical protein
MAVAPGSKQALDLRRHCSGNDGDYDDAGRLGIGLQNARLVTLPRCAALAIRLGSSIATPEIWLPNI